jgi:hypothetical protein
MHWEDLTPPPLQNAVARFDFLLHNAAQRFDSPLYDAVGNQTTKKGGLKSCATVPTQFRLSTAFIPAIIIYIHITGNHSDIHTQSLSTQLASGYIGAFPLLFISPC